MIKTWQQQIYRVILAYFATETLSSEDVSSVKRALYFGSYRYSLHFSPTVVNWTKFNELEKQASAVMAGRGKMTYNPLTLQMNLFGNSSELLHDMHALRDEMLFSSVHIVDENCWDWPMPKPKPKGLYYGKYRYRIRFKAKNWTTQEQNVADLRNVHANWMLSLHPNHNFLYCLDVRDVILAKLLFAHDISEISDRLTR